MNKRYQWAVGAAIVVLVIAGGFLLFSPDEVVIEEEVDEVREVDFTTEAIFEETVEEVSLFKFPEGTDRIEAQEGLIPEESLENDTMKRGELLGLRMIMESMEGVFTIEADVLNEQGREAVAIGGRIVPVEARGGGLITMCCFETFETGNFYVRVTIDGEPAAEVPFSVEIE